ncbi:MAG: hypothetical protein KDI13_06400 [Alphaproteobacteria bacterium]|nr:hypothetical protein [Alphaproteobacteria bacterium]
MSETSKPQEIWYELDTEFENLLNRTVILSGSPGRLRPDEQEAYITATGYNFAVMQTTPDGHGIRRYPTIFPMRSPENQKSMQFFMCCPIGINRTGETTHFIPPNALREITDTQERDQITCRAQFSIPLESRNNIPAPPHSAYTFTPML